MNSKEAHVLLNEILDLTVDVSWRDRLRNMEDLGYPEVANVYRQFVKGSGMTSREFYEQATGALIISHSKLGRALK